MKTGFFSSFSQEVVYEMPDWMLGEAGQEDKEGEAQGEEV